MPRGRPRRSDIKPSQIAGMKHLTNIMDLLRPLREKEGNDPKRKLHYDELIAFILLYFYTPVLTSMRGLQQASKFEILRKKLGLHRFSLGSFSETSAFFDHTLLEPIIEQLAATVRAEDGKRELSVQDLTLAAIDGSMLHALPKMVWALWLDDQHHAAKMHLQFNILKGVPTRAVLTDGNGNERSVLRDILAAGMLYVLDRGYADYRLMDDIIEAKSSFVVRVDNNAVSEVIEERPLSTSARKKGIVRDAVVRLGTPKKSALRDRAVRLIEVHVKDDSGRKRNNRVSSKKTFRTTSGDHTLLLATDLLGLDAELVAEIYRSRWQIELFFRWFKKVLAADRLLCLSKNGMTVVMYCAIIASLLVVLWTGRKPTKRTYEMICFYFLGWISDDELTRHLAALPACS
jgi:hypothetical protein